MTGPEQLAPAVRTALAEAGMPDREPTFERPRNREHGDWSTNVALTLARPLSRPPREIAAELAGRLDGIAGVARVEVAGPGFVNFHLGAGARGDVVRRIVGAGPGWGRSDVAGGTPVNVEFVSANPTGPLHVGHGRQAVLGDAIANLLDAAGWKVTREYYFNDAGRQMQLFADSVDAAVRGVDPPPDGYRGAYIADVAREVEVAGELDELGEAAYRRMLARITATLERLGVRFDVFFGERSLHPDGIADAIAALGDHAYTAEGATWLRTTTFGDDKDRVLLRADGQPTYFAADCAYLRDKFGRGFDRLVYVLGSDHHGYVARLLSVAEALGHDPDRVEVVMHQFVTLLRAGEAVGMSKRTGELVTLDELLDEVGPDAVRYTFLRFSRDVTIDFDLAAVVRADRDNPVYYVQYSHARISGILRMARERGVRLPAVEQVDLGLLTTDEERDLMTELSTFPEVVVRAAQERAPQRVARFLEQLAEAFHRFYTECTVLGDDAELTHARLWLVEATRRTQVNGLTLLGVGAPERM